MAGRPKENSHPAKANKLESQRSLQKIARETEAKEAMKQHDELMDTHRNYISKVCKKLKQIQGVASKTVDIPLLIHFVVNILGRIFWKVLEQTWKYCVMNLQKMYYDTIALSMIFVLKIVK